MDTIKKELAHHHHHHDHHVLDLEVLLSVSKSNPEPQQDELQFEDNDDDDDDEEEDILVVKPCGLLQEVGTPPFLNKTYEIVENHETNEIISWGENGFSFVVWDYYNFTAHLLPKYFKHSNFSSFVRQLNTYGFRKVNFDQWEFANAGFQRGKKHLLKSIKRKYRGGNKSNSRLNVRREIEIEELKLEQETLKSEIHDLKQQQLKSNQSLASMEERAKSVQWKQKEILLFLSKTMKRTHLFQQLLLQYRQKKTLESRRVFKRRKLASSEKLNASLPDGLSPRQSLEEQSSSLTSETSSSDLSSGNYIMWGKLMEDDVICEDDEEEAFDVDQTNFIHELEDLITWSPLCGSLANVGDEVGEVPCLGG